MKETDEQASISPQSLFSFGLPIAHLHALHVVCHTCEKQLKEEEDTQWQDQKRKAIVEI